MKGRHVFVVLWVASVMGLLVRPAWAEKAYVTDSFKITFRSGPSIENKVIAFLVSGEPVEVLGSEDGWSQVRLIEGDDKDREGWVLSRYLVTRVPWERQAKALSEENARLKERVTALNQERETLNIQVHSLAEKMEECSETLSAVQDKYNTLQRGAADYLDLKGAYQAMGEELERVRKRVEILNSENRRLSSSQRNRWFATGALVLLCGLLIGLLIGRQQKKRRPSYY